MERPVTVMPRAQRGIGAGKGALLPLTGGFSNYAKLAQCATNLAIDDLNAEYANKGYKFELYVEDTQLDPNVALQKLQTLYAKGVRAVHAGLTSREASGEKPFARTR